MFVFSKIKKSYKVLRNYNYLIQINNEYLRQSFLLDKIINIGSLNTLKFDFNYFKQNVVKYLLKNKVGKDVFSYKYSDSSQFPNIYSSFYALMTYYYLSDLNLSKQQNLDWLNYFNSFQSSKDGLFYDNSIINDFFYNEDWWGARHLTAHLPAAFKVLGGKPKYDFYFLEPLYFKKNLIIWLETRKWDTRLDFVSNEIMNYGVLLQASREFFKNEKSAKSLNMMLDWLENNINQETGLWGFYDLINCDSLSKSIQAAYHIFLLFFYENREIPNNKKIIDLLIKSQNRLGGFGISLNSSACEDIDSIDPLIRFSIKSDYKIRDVKAVLNKALIWVLSNQNNDGGFVFRWNESFTYGHKEMFSNKNESSMFATWFRTLCLGYLINYLYNKSIFNIGNSPGYSFWGGASNEYRI
ncbi:hypothetical protein GF385_00080 [Candidatus Dependentiae bacterium]|nr:hypothetical protein [Candidatus Dependentiae bacterium]